MTEEPILIEVEQNVGHLVLNRPDKRNAITNVMVERLLAGLDDLEANTNIRAVLLRANGASFCSGVDLADMLATREESGAFDFGRLPELFERLASCPKPTVAVVRGPAIAGGCELALHCDIRIGTPAAMFAMPLAKLGLVVPGFAAEWLVQTVGLTAARDLLLTGDPINAERALQIGMLSRLVPDAEFDQVTRKVVRALTQNAPLALRATKKILAKLGTALTPDEHAAFTAERLEISRSRDLQEGLKAFFEKRAPNFTGS